MRNLDWIHLELVNWAAYKAAGNAIPEYPRPHPKPPPMNRLYVPRGRKEERRDPPDEPTAERIERAYVVLRATNPRHASLIHMRYINRMQSKHIAKIVNTTPGYIDKLMGKAKIEIWSLVI